MEEFSIETWGSFHDVVLDATHRDASFEEAKAIFDSLPDYIKKIGYEWGFDDTVFCDKAYVYLENLIKIQPEPIVNYRNVNLMIGGEYSNYGSDTPLRIFLGPDSEQNT